ncbi:hypothetical protein NPIL_453541 [Nephila pilipes]|uniref:Uncharacterized protein n=1 Tax=Nephila pilipes TaxID=299642 RepID=A0A8X6TFS9_NEPPI|nr:hypothetical protein NPIL_453541 [Nephila pilipes]
MNANVISKRHGLVDALIHTPSHQRTTFFFNFTRSRDKGRRTHFCEVCEGRGCRKTDPGAVQKGNIRRVMRKDSPRGTTGSRHPSGVPSATLRSHAGEQRLTGYFRIRSVFLTLKATSL